MTSIPPQRSPDAKAACYVGVCPAHEWEGMQRQTWQEAQADLDGHTGYFPDEPHTGAGVIPC